MTCPTCARENRPGARFCGGCGASLAPRCPACGASGAPDSRFCDACGAPYAGAGNKAIARKVVTVVFADLKGSMGLHERRDAESARRVTDRYHRAMTAAVEVHGGRVVQLAGDGVLAAFGVPRVAEDDALRAVRAAAGMQRAFREFAREQGEAMAGIGLRVAVNTGEIVVSEDETAVIGDATNVAARLQHEAGEGEVIVGEATQRLVGERVTLAPLGSFALRGRQQAVAAYRLVSLDAPARAQTLALVGRDEELRRLFSVYEAACAAPGPRLTVVLGSPGLGKSRLLAEFTRRAGERANVIAVRCDEAPVATFAPIVLALRGFLGIEEGAGRERLHAAIDALVPGSDAERARIAAGIAALLSGEPASPEETFFVVRRFLAALAAVRPVVLAIDDLHWAEPLLFDLVEHLVQWSAGVPLLLVAAARPELREARSALVTPGPLVADVLTLAGLEAGSAMRLAANVIGASELPAALAGRVLATSEGNPLFVSELVRMLVEDGVLRREGERWVTTVELASLEMPPTIGVLLAARIERLRPEERAVLERAAVVGRTFSREAVAHLLGRDAGGLDARLEALRRSELIEPDTGWFLGDPGLRFHHVLIRDAAYRRVLRETRAELHERCADWVAARARESVEHDEAIGWHLEQAHANLRELGALDARGRLLGERAARHLGDAGRRALARDDLAPAAGLFARALACLPAEQESRADLALDWCEALLSAGEVAPAQAALAELGRLCGESARLRAWHTCFRGQLAALTDPRSLRATAGEVAAAAQTLASLGDAAGEAKAHAVHATSLQRLGEIGACETALDRALAAARRANDRRRANAAMVGAPQAALWGPTPVTRASGRCLDVVRVLRITQGAPAVEAVALRCQALLEELRGRSEAARRMIASSRHMVEELGVAQQIFEADVYGGHIELLEGDAAAAERFLRRAYDGLREHALGIDAARAGALLGRALLAQQRAADAEALSHESEALAGDDLKAAMGWRGVRAEALARRGEHARALELAREGVEIAARTDDLLDHADARSSLAVALRAAGRGAEADAEERRALELWERKGATLLVERARGRARPESAVEAPAERSPAPLPAARRRVRPNFATAHLHRLDAAIAARDFATLAALNTPTFEGVHHPSATVAGAELPFTLFQPLALQAEGLRVEHEPLATLGDALALARADWSASSFTEASYRVGAAANRWFVVLEAEPDERASRAEVFAESRLGEALACLYGRYAASRPAGPERERALAIAASAADSSGAFDVAKALRLLADDIEFADHRTLGFGSTRGARALGEVIASLAEAAPDATNRIDDVLATHPDGFLLRLTNAGTDRTSGGAFERSLLRLMHYDAAGRADRVEQFDLEREAQALARFDELVRERPPTASRRVEPNAATITAGRLERAVAERDENALARGFSPDFETVDHSAASSYGRDATLASWTLFVRSEDSACRYQPLATLGDSLALLRFSRTASATRWRPPGEPEPIAVGEFASEELHLLEADDAHELSRCELFAAHGLGEAVVRLYERYAERLPQGPERDRALRMAEVTAVLSGPVQLDRYATSLSPDLEFTDRRTIGFESTRGSAAFLELATSLLEAAPDACQRFDEILELRSDAWLVRNTNHGTDRATGGPFERPYLLLVQLGGGGRGQRFELFDSERDAEARARFDELTSERTPATLRRVRPNAATSLAARVETAVAARDLPSLVALTGDEVTYADHTTASAWDRSGVLASWQGLFRTKDPSFRYEPIATLGESLALLRERFSASASASGRIDVAEFEIEHLALLEVGVDGRLRAAERFGSENLAEAVVRSYERYAELLRDPRDRERTAAIARSLAAFSGPWDLERRAAVYAAGLDYIDRRGGGVRFEPTRGREAMLAILGSMIEASPDFANRFADVLDLRSDAVLLHIEGRGTSRSSGGAFDREVLLLLVFDADGRVAKVEQFDVASAEAALARFDALAGARTAAPPRRVRSNLATEHAAQLDVALAARDAAALPELFADAVAYTDHTTATVWDRRAVLASMRSTMRAEGFVNASEPLATLGEGLALTRRVISASAARSSRFDVAGYVIDRLSVVEVGADGRLTGGDQFASGRLGEAMARLYERYAERLPPGPEREGAERIAAAIAVYTGPISVERRVATWSPDVEFADHRTMGFAAARGIAAFRDTLSTLLELAPDASQRWDEILDLRPDAWLVRNTNLGTDRATGGPFERPYLLLVQAASDGLVRRVELFDEDHDAEAFARFDALTRTTGEQGGREAGAAGEHAAFARRVDRALAHFAELRPDPLRIPANAASRLRDRMFELVAAREWRELRALAGEGFQFEDRGRRALVVGGVEEWAETLRFAVAEGAQPAREPIGTAGDRIALERVRWTGEASAGEFELEAILLSEVDAEGLLRAMVKFDPEDRAQAFAEMNARFAAAEGASHPALGPIAVLGAALARRDWPAARACLDDAFELHDQRALGIGKLSRDEWIASLQVEAELAPDVSREVFRTLALGDRGRVALVRRCGTLRDGGPFENLLVALTLADAERVLHYELFDAADVERALARFEELSAVARRSPA